jgi:hypothetical protein
MKQPLKPPVPSSIPVVLLSIRLGGGGSRGGTGGEGRGGTGREGPGGGEGLGRGARWVKESEWEM